MIELKGTTVVWALWLAVGDGVLLLALVACAGFVALFVQDADRRKVAYEVLKLVLRRGSVGGVVVTALVGLHRAGLW